MNQKAFTLGFIAVTIIVALGIAVSRFGGGNQVVTNSPTPTSSPQGSSQALSNPDGNNSPVEPSPTQGGKSYSKAPDVLSATELKNKKVVIETDKGNIEFELYADAPEASSNFIFLAGDGFYDNLTFHRVEPGFVIQGGDPQGTGIGGPGYTFKEDKLLHKDYKKGIVAMAKKGNEPAGTGGSQFFIMLEDTPLPNDYVIFGEVTEGQDVVSKITKGDIMKKVTIEALK